MLLTVFTPVARTEFLSEAWRSLLLQQDVSWEWVLGLTGGVPRDAVPEAIRRDSRVRVIRCGRVPDGLAPGIGMSKRECCHAGKGDAFVELDHDDILAPGILATIAKLLDRGAGFIYSDAAIFRHDAGELLPVEYDPSYGWSSYPVRVYGRQLLANRSFGVSARSLADVMFAPDHVRAWSRQAYMRAGGHDPDLPVGDDHDLLCRTYLTGAAMVHTGSVGYLYRWHGGNATARYNQAIQRQNAKNREKYMGPLIAEWLRRQGLESVTLKDVDPGKSLPVMCPDSVGQIVLDRCLDRCEQQDIPALLQRAWRALAPGGWLSCRVVSSASKWAFLPHRCSWWNEVSLASVCSPGYWKSCRPELSFAARFQPVRILEKRDPNVDGGQDRTAYLEIIADLCCLKGQRQPGLIPE